MPHGDRPRVGARSAHSLAELSDITKRLAPRWFLMRDVHSDAGTVLMQPRWAMSFMRGPMTAVEVRRARGANRDQGLGRRPIGSDANE
jgi:hypothetical protein